MLFKEKRSFPGSPLLQIFGYFTDDMKKTLNSSFIILNERLQISLPVLSEFKKIYELLFPLKSSENRSFSGDFRGNKS